MHLLSRQDDCCVDFYNSVKISVISTSVLGIVSIAVANNIVIFVEDT